MLRLFCWVLVGAIVVSGCATVRHVMPLGVFDQVSISGMEDIRAVSGIQSEFMVKDFVSLLEQEERNDPIFFKAEKIYSMLAISGGAANGAYGAGLLNGWSKEGSRPVFKVVTGISTGAIIAPFVFLGSEYDTKLKEFYTKYATRDLMREKGMLRALFSNSLVSDSPLERLINKDFDNKFLQKIAGEYQKGRRLYVGTTNLDTQRLVIWDMGKIAAKGDDDALRLFRKIVLASVSIPVAFPPVYLNVEAGDKVYDEMHVDGGITKQVFFLFDVIQGLDRAARSRGIDVSRVKYKIFIIRNGYVEAVWKEVPDRLSSIAERTVDTMTNSQGVGDLYQLYTFTKMGKGDFNLAYIPASHVSKAKELFDLREMRALFDLGFEEAAQGYPWRKTPPGLDKWQ